MLALRIFGVSTTGAFCGDICNGIVRDEPYSMGIIVLQALKPVDCPAIPLPARKVERGVPGVVALSRIGSMGNQGFKIGHLHALQWAEV